MVTTMKKLVLLTALILSASATAGQRPFTKLDADGSQTLSLNEFLIYIKPASVAKMTKEFNRRDKNEDGELTLKEYTLKKKKG